MDKRPLELNLAKLGKGTNPAAAPTPAPDPNKVSTPEEIKDEVVKVLHTVYDPEIPVNIFELGLVYELDVSPERAVTVRMTLTSPACPVAGSLPGEVQSKIKAVPGVTAAKVDLVWDPPWDKDRMSDAAKLELGLFDY